MSKRTLQMKLMRHCGFQVSNSFHTRSAARYFCAQNNKTSSVGPAIVYERALQHYQRGSVADLKEAAILFERAAEQGHKEAQLNLAKCYGLGEGVAVDPQATIKWLCRALNDNRTEQIPKDQVEAASLSAEQFKRGDLYYHGKGVVKDVKEAARLFKLSADQGNSDGQNSLGECHYHGEGVDKDIKEAVRLYRLSANQGNAKAQTNLGECYYLGVGVDWDDREAVRLFQLSADQGNARAQCHLGLFFYHAHGVEYKRSNQDTANLFQLSAAQGDARGQCCLGWCYETGHGVDRDYEKAANLYRLAADQGDSAGQYRLGLCYKYGMGVAKDWPEAARLFKLAASQGNEEAKGAFEALQAKLDRGERATPPKRSVMPWEV